MIIDAIKKTLSKYYDNVSISESINGEDFISYDLHSNGKVLFGIDCLEDDNRNLIDFWTKESLFDLTNKVSLDFEAMILNKYSKIKNLFLQKNIKTKDYVKRSSEDFINEDYYDRPYYLYSLSIEDPLENPIVYITVYFEMTEEIIKPVFFISFGDFKNNDYFYVDFEDDDKLIEVIDKYLTLNLKKLRDYHV